MESISCHVVHAQNPTFDLVQETTTPSMSTFSVAIVATARQPQRMQRRSPHRRLTARRLPLVNQVSRVHDWLSSRHGRFFLNFSLLHLGRLDLSINNCDWHMGTIVNFVTLVRCRCHLGHSCTQSYKHNDAGIDCRFRSHILKDVKVVEDRQLNKNRLLTEVNMMAAAEELVDYVFTDSGI